MHTTFVDIKLERIDIGNATRTKMGIYVPYILSEEPPKEWKDSFLKRINGEPFTAGGPVKHTTTLPHPTTKIEGNTVMFECDMDKTTVKGMCWEIVAAHVDDANKFYHKVEEHQRRQQLAEETEQERAEQLQKELDDFKRDFDK
ncbi:MAG: hypothetical protein ACXVIG_04935 [Halobacteriota archaeon]